MRGVGGIVVFAFASIALPAESDVPLSTDTSYEIVSPLVFADYAVPLSGPNVLRIEHPENMDRIGIDTSVPLRAFSYDGVVGSNRRRYIGYDGASPEDVLNLNDFSWNAAFLGKKGLLDAKIKYNPDSNGYVDLPSSPIIKFRYAAFKIFYSGGALDSKFVRLNLNSGVKSGGADMADPDHVELSNGSFKLKLFFKASCYVYKSGAPEGNCNPMSKNLSPSGARVVNSYEFGTDDSDYKNFVYVFEPFKLEAGTPEIKLGDYSSDITISFSTS